MRCDKRRIDSLAPAWYIRRVHFGERQRIPLAGVLSPLRC